MEIKLFAFLVETFQCSKFHEKEAKHDKRNFKRFHRDIRGQKLIAKKELLEKLG